MMPYIKRSKRSIKLLSIVADAIDTEGELNYCITKLCLLYLGNNAHYEDYNRVMGVLISVQHEFYRRYVAPYEDQKRKENGDV